MVYTPMRFKSFSVLAPIPFNSVTDDSIHIQPPILRKPHNSKSAARPHLPPLPHKGGPL